jgi:ribosomal protein L11 methyltransferase
VSRVDRWLVLTVRTPSRDHLDLVAEGLFALGASGVLEEGDARVVYLTTADDPDGFVDRVRARIAAELPEGTPLDLEWRWQADEDWAAAWKRGLQPRKVTRRVVVKPTWTEWAPAPTEVVIDIDPQMAFGTGEHATTRGCIRLLDGAIREGDRVLDVGSGSGILAIAAARLGAAEVVAVEYDPDANLNARENLELNSVSDRVRILERLADAALIRDLAPFDLILANILSGVIRPLLPAFAASLREEGRLIVSGILRSEHAEVVAAAERAGFRISRVDEEEEWWSALLVVERAGPENSNGGP